MKTNDRFYLPELDGLRFIAFLLVFIHHAPVLANPAFRFIHSFGWIGVDLFFALSAFLFVQLLRKEFEQAGTIIISKFYIRRALRIWPLYIIFCVSMITIGSFKNNSYSISSRALGLFTFTDNIFSAVKGYNPIPYTAHLWTISYEEQFYLIIPITLLFIFKAKQSKVTLFLSSSAFLFFFIRALMIVLKFPHPAIWVLPFTHFESILLGIMVGLGAFDRIFYKFQPLAVLGVGLVCGWLMTCLPPLEIISFRMMFSYPLIGICTSAVVYFVFKSGKTQWMKWLSFGPFVFFGKISYGLYVYHILGLSIGAKIISKLACFNTRASAYANVSILLLSFGITIFIASSSYFIIEKPFLKLKKRFEIINSRPA